MTKRPIEFMAWDSSLGIMTKTFSLNDIHANEAGVWAGEVDLERKEDYTFMRFTGLLDKNGTKIFEGDIVLCNNLPNTVPVEIRWSDKRAGFVVFNSNTNIEHKINAYGDPTGFEVIGSIYQNPEILKEGV